MGSKGLWNAYTTDEIAGFIQGTGTESRRFSNIDPEAIVKKIIRYARDRYKIWEAQESFRGWADVVLRAISPRIKKRDNIGVVVIIPSAVKRWNIRIGESCTLGVTPTFSESTVEIRRPGGLGLCGDYRDGDFLKKTDFYPQLWINGEFRQILSYGKSKNNNRIRLELDNGEFWFHCLHENKTYNPACVDMLRNVLALFSNPDYFPKNTLQDTKMGEKIDNMEDMNKNKTFTLSGPWTVSVAETVWLWGTPDFSQRKVEIRKNEKDELQFYVNDIPKTIKSYGKSKGSNRISINFKDIIFKDGGLWFSCLWNDTYNPACVAMLRAAYHTFPQLHKPGEEGSWFDTMIDKIQKMEDTFPDSEDLLNSQKPTRSRRLSRQPVNYGNHFPPFVRTCLEILDALNDANERRRC